MKTSRKVLIAIPATTAALVLLWLFAGFQHRRILAADIKEDIGYKLLLQFRSKYVPTIGTGTVERLRAIHVRAPNVRIRPGDAPAPIGDGTADYQIIYVLSDWRTNTDTPILGLRMKGSGTNHHVLGHWTPDK